MDKEFPPLGESSAQLQCETLTPLAASSYFSGVQRVAILKPNFCIAILAPSFEFSPTKRRYSSSENLSHRHLTNDGCSVYKDKAEFQGFSLDFASSQNCRMTPNPSIERTSTGLAHSAPQVYVPLRGPSRFRPAHVKR
jgi:hypothetical protein